MKKVNKMINLKKKMIFLKKKVAKIYQNKQL